SSVQITMERIIISDAAHDRDDLFFSCRGIALGIFLNVPDINFMQYLYGRFCRFVNKNSS
nr:hypothetical protein [Spirochaetota bacterium]